MAGITQNKPKLYFHCGPYVPMIKKKKRKEKKKKEKKKKKKREG